MTERVRLAVLGATGSIGQQALDVVRAHPDRLEVVSLGANRSTSALEGLAMEFPRARTALGCTDESSRTLSSTSIQPACTLARASRLRISGAASSNGTVRVRSR